MTHVMTKFGELVRVAVPVVAGGLLWGYLAGAVLYGVVSV
jgi:hypothetical protein